MALIWIDKTDNIDEIHAEDVNSLAHSIQQLENDKVDKIEGKTLTSNDFTDTYKTKLDGLKNYDDTAIKALIENKVDKADGYGLSKIKNMTMSPQQSGKYLISTERQDGLISNCTVYKSDGIDTLLGGKADKVDGKGLSANDYTDEDKAEVAKVKDKQDKLVFDNYPKLNSTNPVTSHGLFLMWDEFNTKTTFNSGRIGELEDGKSDKATYSMMTTGGAISYDLKDEYNRMTSYISAAGEITSVSISISDGAYRDDYISGLSFISGSTPPEVSYPSNPYTMRWIGSECTISGESSVFSPVANKVYDIIFYFNGSYIVGLVVGYDNIA